MKRYGPFKIVIFDLDGTLTRERSVWEYIHKRLGKWFGFAEEYQRKFLAGEITYERFCELDAQVWKGMRVEELSTIVRMIPFHPGAEELMRYLKERGLKLAMISSGLSILSNWVHQRYGFDFSVCNDLLHEEGLLTGKVTIRVYFDQKAVWVDKILKRFKLTPEECIAIGDSSGDMDMFKRAGFSIAFNSSCEELNRLATRCVGSRNLADIIHHLPF